MPCGVEDSESVDSVKLGGPSRLAQHAKKEGDEANPQRAAQLAHLPPSDRRLQAFAKASCESFPVGLPNQLRRWRTLREVVAVGEGQGLQCTHLAWAGFPLGGSAANIADSTCLRAVL